MPLDLLSNNKKLNILLVVTYASFSALLLLLITNYLIKDESSWKLLFFQTIPLLIQIPGLLKKHYRSHSWLCFVILAYFTAYVVEVGSPLAEVSDWIGLVLSIFIFIGAMLSSRGLQRLEHR